MHGRNLEKGWYLRDESPGKVLFFLGGGAVGAPWPDAGALEAAPGSAAASWCCCCGDSSGLIWSCWSPSLIPKNAAADEFDAIASRFIPAPTRRRQESFSSPVVALACC